MRKRTVLRATLCCALATAAAPAFAAAAAAADGPPVCPITLVRSPQERPGFFLGAARISAAAAVDLEFDVLLSQLDGLEHVLQLRLFLPSGDLYQTLDVPIAGDTLTPLHSVAGKPLEGYPRPVPENRPQWFKLGMVQYRIVRVPFPVAGTAIVHNSLYGRWTLEAYLDGSDAPCGKAVEFVIGR